MSTAAEDPVWTWYDDKRREAESLREAIAVEQAQKRPDPKRLRKLRAQLELAEYVGD